MSLVKALIPIHQNREVIKRTLTTSSYLLKAVAGRPKKTKFKTNPLTYSQALTPNLIGVSKCWNSWNTGNLWGEGEHGWRSDMAVSDMWIRQFMKGTFHNMLVQDIIIKRQFNMVRIGIMIAPSLVPSKVYFLIGYTEELLTHVLRGPVKLEVVVVKSKEDVIYKRV